MKHLLATIVLVLLVHSGFSQKIYFSDTSNKWRVFTNNCGDIPYLEWFTTFHLGGDTVLAGLVYKKVFYHLAADPIYFIREDTVQKKVYLKTYTNIAVDIDSNEKILYDYTLQLGDTVRFSYPAVNATFRVASIDSVFIAGQYYKVWHMRNDSGSILQAALEYIVVEGIGCLTDPQYPVYPYFYRGCGWLTCFQNNGQSLPLSKKIARFDNLTSCAFTAVKEELKSNTAAVYPNPANSTSVIDLMQPMAHGQLNIYDVLGRLVHRASINNERKIPIGKYLSTPGQYYFKIVDNETARSYTGKFIFE